MLIPVRTLLPQDAEVLARTVVPRTLVRGIVEVFGLTWKTDALHSWEHTERALGREPKVDVRIDELDLHVVYVDVPDSDRGPIKLDSRQPEFTRGLSLFELNRLKKAVKDKGLAEKIGRMSDSEALKLRVAWYAELGHGHDPAAQKRLSDLQNQLAQLRLRQAGMTPPDEQAQESPPPSAPRPRRAKVQAPPKPVKEQGNPPAPQVSDPNESPAQQAPTTHECKPGDLPNKPKYPSINLKRRPT